MMAVAAKDWTCRTWELKPSASPPGPREVAERPKAAFPQTGASLRRKSARIVLFRQLRLQDGHRRAVALLTAVCNARRPYRLEPELVVTLS
jgi:hypothetical protein